MADEKAMPFLGHLEELRKRIIWSLVAIGVGFILAFNFSEKIINFLAQPIAPIKLAFLTPTEAFWVNMKVGFFLGLGLAMPVVLYQIWAFISPGLLPHERKYALPFVLFSTLFFAIGVLFCHAVVLPFALKFLLTYKTENLQAVISLNSYMDFVLKFMLGFGLVFELPLVITLLAKLGIVTPQFLSKNRKYAVLINFVLAAVLTPTPDIFNQLLMALPLCLLYELGIISARIFGRRPQPTVTG